MIRRSRTRARRGEYLMVDDRSGRTIWSGDARKEWQGLIVHKSLYETRHPQDLIRPRRENFRLPDARPVRDIEDETFVGPLVTEIAPDAAGENSQYAPMGTLGQFALGQAEEDLEESNEAGSIFITVTSTRRMSADDRIGIMLDSGDLFLTRIYVVAGPTSLQITEPLPERVSAGNRVFDYTAGTHVSIE